MRTVMITPARLSATAVLCLALAAPVAGAAETGTTGYQGACPAHGRISQGYHSGHDGVDIAAGLGAPIYAAGPGKVIASGPAGGYGQWIRIRHTDGTVTEYGHMRKRHVGVNATVQAGQRIADVGREGQATGPHLHFETHPNTGSKRGVNTVSYLNARGVKLPC